MYTEFSASIYQTEPYSVSEIFQYIPKYPRIESPDATNEKPGERKTLTEKVIIDDVNKKLIEMYETPERLENCFVVLCHHSVSSVSVCMYMILSYLCTQGSSLFPEDIPRLEATIEGLQMLLQEKQERINDLKKENERLDFYALYFKSQDVRRLEANTEEIKVESRNLFKSQPAAQERREQARIIKRNCKNCNQPFEAANSKKETCSDKCRIVFSRRKIIEYFYKE